MYLIGLTGGIAAGKSVIARRLEEHGAVVIDADKLSRQAVEPGTPALQAIAARFGSTMLRHDGTLDRAALGDVIFADARAREDLNAIVHPAVRELTAQRIAEASARDPDAVIVYDVPLLVEASVPHRFDLVVVAHAPAEVRTRRLVELRHLPEADAALRVSSQASDEERLAVADVVIDTSGTLESTLDQADAVAHAAALNAPSATRSLVVRCSVDCQWCCLD